MGQGVRIYVYPWLDAETGKRLALDTIAVPDSVRQLFGYLVDRGYVQPLDGLSDEALRVQSDHIYEWIRTGNPRWQDHVEPGVAEAIRKGRLFGYDGD